MQDFPTAFPSSCEGKSTEQLWQEFKGEVDTLIKRYVPTKTLRCRKTLPWVTQEIRRKINLRDRLYQLQKNSTDTERERFKKVKHEVDSMLKTSYNNYLDSLVGIIDDSLSTNSSRPDNKKLFSYLKNCRRDSRGSAPLKQNGHLTTNTVEKANILNNQFQPVFTPKSPLKQSCAFKKFNTSKMKSPQLRQHPI